MAISKKVTSTIGASSLLALSLVNTIANQDLMQSVFSSVKTEAFGEVCGYSGCVDINQDSVDMYRYQKDVLIDVLANDSVVDPVTGSYLALDEFYCRTDNQNNIDVLSPSNGTAVYSGNQILYTPNPGYFGNDVFTYCAEDPVQGNLGYENVFINIVDTESLTLEMFKSKSNNEIMVGDVVTIQATVTNPNNFAIKDVNVDLVTNSQEVSIVPGSANFGQINGDKFAKLKQLITGPKVEAFDGGNLAISGNTVNATFDSLDPNEVVNIVFAVNVLQPEISEIDGTASFGVSPQATANVVLTPQDATNPGGGTQENPPSVFDVLPRTGGFEELTVGQKIQAITILLIALIGLPLVLLQSILLKKKSKQTIK